MLPGIRVDFDIADKPIVESWTPSPKAPSTRPFFVEDVVKLASPSSSPPASPTGGPAKSPALVEWYPGSEAAPHVGKIDLQQLEKEMMYDRSASMD